MTGFVAFGSNLGDRESYLRAGLEGLVRRGIEPRAVSSVWETEPVDCPERLWFLNLVVRVRTAKPPLALLDALLDIELENGRVRTVPNAPRRLDLDLLTLGDVRMRSRRLTLPHPRMWGRRFVLEPLAELAPGLRNPDTGETVAEICRRLPAAPEVRRVGILAVPSCGPV